MSNRLFRAKALEKLRSPDQLDDLMTVISPSGWLVVVGLGALLVAVLAWASLATIQSSVGGEGVLAAADGGLEGVVYLPLSEGQRIAPGMAVQLAPLSVRKEEHGLLRGEVAAVRRAPATREQMLAALQSDALVDSLINAGALIEVRVRLVPSAATPSGYAWTSALGPPAPLAQGVLFQAQIVVSEQRPIGLLFPGFL